MPAVKLNLGAALETCPATIGMPAGGLSFAIDEYLKPVIEKITIILDNKEKMDFILHKNNAKSVLTSIRCLSSDTSDVLSMEHLPEILEKLSKQNVQFNAIQFPYAFEVNGWGTNIKYRAHFNQIVIFKNSDSICAHIIDSTFNPIGIYNPLPVIGCFFQNSILSGKELQQVKLKRLLSQPSSINGLQTAMGTTSNISVAAPILTNKQPTLGDKRCGIYVLSSMAALINGFLSETVTNETITTIVSQAHQTLNEPDMMKISFPEQQANSSLNDTSGVSKPPSR